MAGEGHSRPIALVTGASSGIGAAFAERLAHDGHDVIVVARRRDRLEALARRLESAEHVSVEVIALDLTRPDQLLALERRVGEGPALDLLVNNAGSGGYQPFVEIDPDRAEELVRLQVVAVMRLTRAALPAMVARRKGAIINVSSRLAFSAGLSSPPLPKRVTYAASKAFVNTFTRILQNELEGTGVRAQVLCPGLVRTEFHTTQGIDTSRFPADAFMRPEDVVRASLEGLRLGEVVCVPALDDPDRLERITECERDLLAKSAGGTIASRYSKT